MHLFILAATNMHSSPFLHYLTDICGMTRGGFRVLFFDIDSEDELPSGYSLEGIDVYYSQDWENTSIYSSVKNITISSLSSVKGQAEYIYKIFDLGLVTYDQLIIRITDDEVDRWITLHRKNGKLVECKKAHVDTFTTAILQHASRFICLYKPWGKALEEILDRKITIYNISILVDPFTNPEVAKLYQGALRASIRNQVKNSGAIRILMHTKPTTNSVIRNILFKDLFSFLLRHSDLLGSRTLEVSLWWPTSIREMPPFNLVIGLLVSVSKIKKIKLRFNFINNMPTEVYYSLLSSVHILIAQNRGGLGAIFEASKNGSIIVLKKGSYNAEVYAGYGELPFIESSENENLFVNSIQMLKENSFEALLNKQEFIAAHFFEKEFLKSKNNLVELYS